MSMIFVSYLFVTKFVIVLVYLNLLSIISCTRKFMVISTFVSLMLFNTSRMLPTDVCPLSVFRIFCTLSSDRAPSSMLQCIYNTFNYDVAYKFGKAV